jgi:DNA-binding beta-propeller fold protein YncE
MFILPLVVWERVCQFQELRRLPSDYRTGKSSHASRKGKRQRGLKGQGESYVRRHAKASTAGSTQGSGTLGVRTLSVIAALGVSLLLALALSAPALALPSEFGAEGSAAGEFNDPEGIAVDQQTGAVYIADRNNNRIDKFGPAGEFLLAWGWGVADGTTEELQICTTTCFGGREESPFEGAGAGQFALPEGIAVDNALLSSSRGDVYVIDSRNNRVQKFGPEGEFLLMFGGEVDKTSGEDVCTATSGDECGAGIAGTGPGQFERLNGRSIAVDSSGHVFVGDENRIQEFAATGALEGEVALPGSGFIENLALDSAGDLYVKSRDLSGVRKYDGSGAQLGAPRDEAGQRWVFAIGPADELFVKDSQGTSHILAYDPSGKQLSSFDGVNDEFRGITYSPVIDAFYVADAETVRIVSPLPPGPLVLPGSESASEIQPTTATLSAEVNPENVETEYRFRYGTTTAYGEETAAATVPADFEDHPVSAELAGLQPRTAYHYRVVASSECEPVANPGHICVSEGEDEEFKTLPPVSIDAESVGEVDSTSAKLETELNPHGLPSEYRFEFGPTSSYGASFPVPDASAGSGTADVARSALVQSLSPSTTYHYRVVAHNSLGTVEGEDRQFTTQGAAAALLPDGRQWEMVSPPDKHGSPLEALGTEEGASIQAAAAGGALTYAAKGPVEANPAGNRASVTGLNQVVSQRDGNGWSSREITLPNESVALGSLGNPTEYMLFSSDLSLAAVDVTPVNNTTPLSPQTTEPTPYLRQVDGEFTPLVNASNVKAGTEFGCPGGEDEGGVCHGGVTFEGASPDLSRVILSTGVNLTAGFEGAGATGLFEWSDGTLRPVSILPGGESVGEAGYNQSGVGFANQRGAVSTESDRVVFFAGRDLYLRDMTLGQTVQLDAQQGGSSAGPVAVFQGANRDASKVFFTADSRLTADSTARPQQPDLYVCEVGIVGANLTCTLKDLTISADSRKPADVRGLVSAFGEDGEHVYFAANGVLASSPNSRGETATPGDCEEQSASASCNLYLLDTASGETTLVAKLSGNDAPDWNGNGAGLADLTGRSSPDGRYFAFMSERPLTGYDNRDVENGHRDVESFLYDSRADRLSCVSCDPTGARPRNGVFDTEVFPGLLVDPARSHWAGAWLAGSIPTGWANINLTTARYQSRFLSNSGRLFFNAAEGLVPGDSNGVEDVYQYEPPGVGGCTESSPNFGEASGGCVDLISSGSSGEESAFLDASENGDDVFFLTASRLSTSDVDTALDVYDAHACSAASPCPPSPPSPSPACEGDSCQRPTAPPTEATPSSLTFSGAGNVHKAKAKKSKKHRKRHGSARRHKQNNNKRTADNHRRAGR